MKKAYEEVFGLILSLKGSYFHGAVTTGGCTISREMS